MTRSDRMLASLIVELEALDPATYTHGGGALTHAWALDLVRRSDPELSERMHGARGEPGLPLMTTSGVMVSGRGPLRTCRLARGDRAHVRLTFLGERTCAAAMSALRGVFERGEPIRLGTAHLALRGVRGDGPSDTGLETFEDLLARAAGKRETVMHFESPTAFRRGAAWFALPTPERVFGQPGGKETTTLAARWTSAGGPDILTRFDPARVGAVPGRLRVDRVSAIRGQEAWAFTGSCAYEADGDDLDVLRALCAFATYAGVGWSTTRGFGQSGDEPRTVR